MDFSKAMKFLSGKKTYLCAFAYAFGVFLVRADVITQSQFDQLQSVVVPLVIVCIRQAIQKAQDASKDANTVVLTAPNTTPFSKS